MVFDHVGSGREREFFVGVFISHGFYIPLKETRFMAVEFVQMEKNSVYTNMSKTSKRVSITAFNVFHKSQE